MKEEKRPSIVKLYSSLNVIEAARKRFEWVYNEFENVVVCVSGGKDSTIVYNLALEAARKTGNLPMKVMWLDQEMEWQSTVDSVKEMMSHPDVEPYWYQIPFRMESASSSYESRPPLWNPEDEENWVRKKDPMSIKENTFGTDKFYDLFERITEQQWPNVRSVRLTGVRCEESPVRALGLTGQATYKYVTWGKKGKWSPFVKDQGLEKTQDNQNMTLHPIYDWGFTDVWTAIAKEKWSYSKIYDEFYRYGVPRQEMRVSSVIHEMSIKSLWIMQELDKDTYERISARLAGADSSAKLKGDGLAPKKLPTMFGTWKQYRDFLLEKLIPNEEWKVDMAKQFKAHEKDFDGLLPEEELQKIHIKAILSNDHTGVRIGNHSNAPDKADLKIKRKKRLLAEKQNSEV